MHSLKKFREQLGLSQMQLADLLGISSGLLALVETGRRSLPEKARDIVWNLEILLNDSVSLKMSEPELVPGQQKQLEKQIRLKTRQLKSKKMLLEKCEEKMENLQKVAVLAKVPGINDIWPEGSIEKDAFRLLVRKNSMKISKLFSEIVQLKMKISGLEAEINCYKSMIAGVILNEQKY